MRDELDLICIGRLSVDLYAEQTGAPMHRVSSFRRYLGGSAANIAVGSARLGLGTALVSRVGKDQFGTALLEDLEREGIDTSSIQIDPERLTSVVALALRQQDDFPRLFLYNDTADLAFDPTSFDVSKLRQTRCVLVTGSYLARDSLRNFTHTAIDAAHQAHSQVVIDLDFRTPLWGLAGWGEVTEPVKPGPRVAEAYAEILPKCDLIVGTLDEALAATGEDNAESAVRRLIDLTSGTVVIKLGSEGARVYEGGDVKGESAPGFAVPVVNSVGAGDAFLGGFLTAWLSGESAQQAARLGNAAGALVTLRHGCTPAMPYRQEIERFLQNHGDGYDPLQDTYLSHMHWALTRTKYARDVLVFAMDHRWQLEDMATDLRGDRVKIIHLKQLLFDAYQIVASDIPEAGVLLDHTYGAELLETASGMGHWFARAVEVSMSYPVRISEDANLFNSLRLRPPDEIVKCMVYAHPREDRLIRDQQSLTLVELSDAARAAERELLIELQAPKRMALKGDDVSKLMQWIYDLGINPDWWKLPPSTERSTWASIDATISNRDPFCQGFLVLGQEQPQASVVKSLEVSAAYPTCRGFAVGRALFVEPARRWFRGEVDDQTVVTATATNFKNLIDEWRRARASNQV